MIRYLYIEANRDKYQIARMVKWANVSKSGYYAWHRRQPSQRDINNEDLLRKVLELHKATRESYGPKRMAAQISKDTGRPVNHKRVERIMRQNDLHTKYRRKYKATTYSGHKLPVAENVLNREFEAAHPGEKMVSDITYIPTDEGWLYLAAVIDLFSRQVVGWSLRQDMTRELVIDALRMAWFKRHPAKDAGLIFHSDRGSQYASKDFRDVLAEYGITASMSRRGDCWDNACSETLFGSLKVERLHGQRFKSRRQAKDEVVAWMLWYNRTRLHSTLAYVSPMQFEENWLAGQARQASA